MAKADRLIEVFNEAKAQPPGAQRERLLDLLCQTDSALKEQVLALLGSDARAGAFLSPTLSAPAVPVSEKLGQSIGRYKLLEKIGEGGCGVVYVAEQTEPVRRRVALKVIKLGMDTKAVVARFEAERQALAMMDHPNIARVLDAGTTETGRAYFVMELIRGIRITDYCDQNSLSTEARLDLFIQVCHAIQHAHQKGIIHRDIKPSNILVTLHDPDGVGIPKVIDFGIAKAIEGRLTDATVYTQLQQFIGTPAYMSPEQAGISGLDIDTRSDIYALGVLLYELLTGKTPFNGQRLLASGIDAMRKTIRETEPVRPSTQLTQDLAAATVIPAKPVPGLSIPSEAEALTAARRRLRLKEQISRVRGDLDWIVMKCLEKERARRYETANGLAADVSRHLRNEPVLARPPSTAYKFQKTFRRNRLAVSAMAAVALSLMIGLSVSVWWAIEARHATDGQRKHRLAAEKTAKELRQSLYASEMSAAFQAWRDARMNSARDLLEKQRSRPGSKDPDLRSFDWRYLWKRVQPSELFTLTNAAIWGFALSPDCHTIAGAVFGRLSLWDAATKQRIADLATNDTDVHFTMAFSPDGQSLATSHGAALRIWDVASRQLRVERTNQFQVLGVAFSPDGKTIVTAAGTMYAAQEKGGNGEVRLWDAATGEELPTCLRGITSCAYNAVFSPDGRLIAACGAGDGVVGLWNLETGEMIASFPDHDGFVWGLGFSHDGRFLATADEGGNVSLWDWAAGPIKKTFHAHDTPIYALAFSPGDERLITTSRDWTAKLWDCRTRKELARFAGHEGGVTDAKFFPDGLTVVTASMGDPDLRFWNAQIPSPTQALAKHPSTGHTILFSPDDRFLMRADSSSNQVAFLDPVTGNSLHVLPGHNVAASPEGTLVLLRGSKVVFLNPATLAETGVVDCGARIGSQPAFSPNGKWLAFRRGDREPTHVVILDVQQKREVEVLETPHSGWAPLSFARAGTLLITANWGDESARVWDTASWRQVTNLQAKPSDFGTRARGDGEIPMAVSRDGRLLALAAGAASVRLWDLDRLEELPALRNGAGIVYALAFSPDNKTLAIGAPDRTVKLWNLAARQEVTSLVGHSSKVLGLAFSGDGRILASTGFDTTLRLWPAPSWGGSKRRSRRSERKSSSREFSSSASQFIKRKAVMAPFFEFARRLPSETHSRFHHLQ